MDCIFFFKIVFLNVMVSLRLFLKLTIKDMANKIVLKIDYQRWQITHFQWDYKGFLSFYLFYSLKNKMSFKK